MMVGWLLCSRKSGGAGPFLIESCQQRSKSVPENNAGNRKVRYFMREIILAVDHSDKHELSSNFGRELSEYLNLLRLGYQKIINYKSR